MNMKNNQTSGFDLERAMLSGRYDAWTEEEIFNDVYNATGDKSAAQRASRIEGNIRKIPFFGWIRFSYWSKKL